MTAVKKFMFDLDFDAEAESAAAPSGSGSETAEPEAPAEPETPPAVHTEADLAAARADAYQQGYDAGLSTGHDQGRAAAETEADAAAREALTRVAQGLDRLCADLDAAEARRDREALELAVTMVRRLFPEVQRRYGLTEVENLIQATLGRLRETPQVVVRAHPDTLAHLESRADALAAESGYDGKLRLLAADDMAPGDVAVTWSDGSARRDTAGVWAEIDAAVRDALGPDGAGDSDGAPTGDGADARGGPAPTDAPAAPANGHGTPLDGDAHAPADGAAQAPAEPADHGHGEGDGEAADAPAAASDDGGPAAHAGSTA